MQSPREENSGLTNHFLISTPLLKDSIFYQSVIYICEHNKNGTMGLKINHPMEIKQSEMLNQLEIDSELKKENDPLILDGGPVNVQQGFILHSQKGEWENSLTITDNLYITTSKDILYAIANQTFKQEYLIILGYSGWSPGQVENELKQNSWLTLPAQPELLFQQDKSNTWQDCINQMGFDLSQLSTLTGNA